MSVKCLNEAQKNFITLAYKSKHKTQKELAVYMEVSERTINRVLVEAGLATPVARIKGEAYQIMQLLKKYDVDYAMLNRVLQDKFSAA
jgi:hypothetical protein